MITLFRYRIGPVVFDEARQELVVDGLVVNVQRLPLAVLSLLLARRGEVVTRSEFVDVIWGGRPTVEQVLANAINKLRRALGEHGEVLIETIPRVGYRFAAEYERSAVGRSFTSGLKFRVGDSLEVCVPGSRRGDYLLERMLSQSPGREVWLATNRQTREQRVYKFASDPEMVAGLKREATICRLLHERLGERQDIAWLLGWSLDTEPCFLEFEYGGPSMLDWSGDGDRLAGLAQRERLELFLRIADVVEAAHQVPVLHKDLKPANVLIRETSTGRRVMLTDFGSGRLLEPERLQELGISTMGLDLSEDSQGAATAGTWMYLAPELMQGDQATPQSDIYSLGVLLYQLMLGKLTSPLVSGWERDVDDRLLCADIAKATDGDPGKRFLSVAHLTGELRTLDRRHALEQARHSIEAERRQRQADWQRFQQRLPWLIATVASLALGLTVSVMLYWRANRSERQLAQEYAVSQALNEFLIKDFIGAANPARTGHRNLTVREAALAAADRIDGAFKASPADVRVALHEAMQQTFVGLSEYERSITEGRRGLDALEGIGQSDTARAIKIRLLVASELAETSRTDEAETELKRAQAGIEASHLDNGLLAAQLWWSRGLIESMRMRLPDSLAAHRRAWTIVETMPDLGGDLGEKIELSLADLLQMTGDHSAAEHQFRNLLARQKALHGPGSARACYTTIALARPLGFQKRHDEAIELAQPAVACLKDKLGPASGQYLSAVDVLAGLNYAQQRYDQAAELYESLAEGFSKLQGPVSLRALSARTNAGVARQLAGRSVASERDLSANLSQSKAAFAWTHPSIQTLRWHLADVRLELGRIDGVPMLLEGLNSEALNRGELESDWDARLAYARGRLAWLQGDRRAALMWLERASSQLAKDDGESRLSVSLQKLLEKARR